MHGYLMLAHPKTDHLTAYLRGCRVCRNNTRKIFNWDEDQEMYFFLEKWPDPVAGLQLKGEVLPLCELGWWPCLGYYMKEAVFSDLTQNTVPRVALSLPQQLPLCALWTSSVTLNEPLNKSPHPWQRIKKNHHEIKWNHACENCVK